MKNVYRSLLVGFLLLGLSSCIDSNLDNRNTGPQTAPSQEQGSGPAQPEPESNQTDAQEDSGD